MRPAAAAAGSAEWQSSTLSPGFINCCGRCVLQQYHRGHVQAADGLFQLALQRAGAATHQVACSK